MAQFTAGYGPRISVQDNGDGKIRVIYPPLEFDWQLFMDIQPNSHYLYNQTTNTTALIIDKGCNSDKATTWREKDEAGFWFDIETDYPNADWNDGNRVVPTFQSAPNQYDTIDLAIATMQKMDILIAWYSTTRNDILHVCNGNQKAISFYGGLSRQRVIWGHGRPLEIVGDNSDQTQVVLWRNFTNNQSYDTCVYLHPTTGLAGAGVKFDRVVFYATKYALLARYGIGVSVYNSIVINGSRPNIPVFQNTHEAELRTFFCTVVDAERGFQVIEGWNCIAYGCRNGGFVGCGTLYNCLSTDSSATEFGGSGNISDVPRDEMALWSSFNGWYWLNGRIITNSRAYHAGAPVAGIDYDIDGNPRDPDNPSIGAHEGSEAPYDRWLVTPEASLSVPGIVGSLDAAWTNTSEYPSKTYVFFWDNDTGDFLGGTEATKGQYRIAGLVDNQEYHIYARASDGQSMSDKTPVMTATPQETPPDPPAWSQDPEPGDGQVTVYWTVSQNLQVSVYYKTETDTSWTLAGTQQGSGSMTITNLKNGVLYEFIAIAKTGGYSIPSAVLRATPCWQGTPQVGETTYTCDLLTIDYEADILI